MNLLARYLNGEHKEVYDEIQSMGVRAFEVEHSQQIAVILQESFRRVQFNLNIIYEELKNIGYSFLTDSFDPEDKPFVLPPLDNDSLLSELISQTDPKNIPLTLQYFYKNIGGVDFTWNWEDNPEIPWEGSDPIVVVSLKYIIDWSNDDPDKDELYVGPDTLHKDNISGSGYYISLYDTPKVDGFFSGYDMSFMNYLRLTFENCGFSNAHNCDYTTLRKFCDRVRPKLLEI